ncbi:Phosphoenolpyruvate-dihydroxyacetone phosphotransferase, subunit DhaM; DHA-specific IIA component [Candidatus Hydrogenisulfobacillus filiaventi]|uniref:Phosphoenolpyruvate-dihydroxyacetone phosphotransferase, subunit DhaM DHA-specific IIA component n=1 Tax=Candidatus Hydrogenisulfobacillus filiaventi TaxID=2707344 RepID=A0A6F8ZKB4_9FIRM|nr:dihydroxyacetone kinase [Bacillota bacterium]CAB1130177.1 Phosphoenolpyruvate-dihydroxyacetone phosphotransferase, subunit DhaM; DHA-specific IIA component [Candidatus Hydrogenisulfobacillus filiaventi]
MTALLLVSHSRKLAEGLADLLAQLAPEVPVGVAGGSREELGVSAAQVLDALRTLAASHPEGIVALFDLGGALFSLENAQDVLAGEAGLPPLLIADAPLVEGAVAAALAALQGDPEAVRDAAEAACNTRKRGEG